MATYLTLLILVVTSIVWASASNESSELSAAFREMQNATYFSFVLLIKMYPPERIPGNITFLMPNDRMLSQISLPENEVYSFLLRHSIPSPLLIDYLERFPTGSMIPTNEPNFMLKILNNGRKYFFLNNVQIVSPNICSPPSLKPAGAPITPKDPAAPPGQNGGSPASPTRPSPPLPPNSPQNQISITSPPPIILKIDSNKSHSSQLVAKGLFHSIVPSMLLALVTFHI